MGGFVTGKDNPYFQGKFAGKKAVIIKNSTGKKTPFTYCVVAGLQKYPKPVKKSMSEKRIKKRRTVRPFVKVVNQTHLMPTRYSYPLKEEKELITEEVIGDAA